MRTFVRSILVVAVILVATGSLVHSVYASGVVGDGTAGSCTEAALDSALASGGSITFACGGPITIILTTQKMISINTTMDGGNLITLSGGNATRLFLVNSATTLTLSNITLTNGYVAADGGAIYNNGGTLILQHSTIQKCQTTTVGSGGALVSYGTLTISDSTFVGNKAAGGGALYVRSGQATISNSVLRQNATTSTTSGWGGALLLWQGVRVDMRGGEIANNSADQGGAIHNRFASSTITLNGTNIHNNNAVSQGGGIYNLSGTATLSNFTLQGNSAPEYGGGIFNSGGTATLTNVTLQGNTAEGNTAGTAGLGGGIYNSGGTATLTNVTLQGNMALHGGIFNSNTTGTQLFFKNVVIDNSGTSSGNYNCDGVQPSASFSLSTDSTCALSGAGNFNNTPALLGPLQDNGGGMLTLLPQPNSPLIDNGQCVAGVTTDERGVARPQGAACDIGAVEVVPAPPATATPTTAPPSPTATNPPPSPTTTTPAAATPTTAPPSPTATNPPPSPTTTDASPTASMQPPTPTPPNPAPSPTSVNAQDRSVFLPLVQR
ncbi:MAG: hypothetical protein NVSMB42_07860 [Herpetosiphon sp.]